MVTGDVYHEETFVSDGNYPDNDFGNWMYATKSETKFHDMDRSGTWDAGELGLSG